MDGRNDLLSARALAREKHVDRERIGEAIRKGELVASRLGKRRYQVRREDFENWLRSRRVRPDSDAAHVEQLLAREARAATT